jgi:hypothetical protein
LKYKHNIETKTTLTFLPKAKCKRKFREFRFRERFCFADKCTENLLYYTRILRKGN